MKQATFFDDLGRHRSITVTEDDGGNVTVSEPGFVYYRRDGKLLLGDLQTGITQRIDWAKQEAFDREQALMAAASMN